MFSVNLFIKCEYQTPSVIHLQMQLVCRDSQQAGQNQCSRAAELGAPISAASSPSMLIRARAAASAYGPPDPMAARHAGASQQHAQ